MPLLFVILEIPKHVTTRRNVVHWPSSGFCTVSTSCVEGATAAPFVRLSGHYYEPEDILLPVVVSMRALADSAACTDIFVVCSK